MNEIAILNIPELHPALQLQNVLQKFDALVAGESFLLVNDHDPVPLLNELKNKTEGLLDWKKLEDGPEIWKVQVLKTDSPGSCAVTHNMTIANKETEIVVLNVPQLEPRLKHPTVFNYFDGLKGGEAFQILNDHDPKPLYYQLLAERGNIFTWEYLEQGPLSWRVQIRKKEMEAGETVGQIAAKDIRKAEVFRKYGIDFCCGGKKTVKQVCEEKSLDLNAVEAALNNASVSGTVKENFDKWKIDFLTDYIYNKHHQYYYEEAPVIEELLEKVINRHGQHFPVLQKIFDVYKSLATELNAHFAKEEQILFPFIKALVQTKNTGNTDLLRRQFSLTEPVKMMEAEHEAAGEFLEALQKLTGNYNAPEGACNSFQFLYQKLKELDEDLHQHIHLENNLLFPKALQLEKELRTEFINQ